MDGRFATPSLLHVRSQGPYGNRRRKVGIWKSGSYPARYASTCAALFLEFSGLVILFIGLGLLLFLGGIGAAVYGLPYLVLEYGFTFVIGGIVAATGGLVLIGIGVLLREMRRVGMKLVAPEAGVAMPVAGHDRTPAPATDSADTARTGQQGDLFAPAADFGAAKVAAAGASISVAALGGAALAASRVSPFDKIERALEDVLETTRGDAREGAATDDDGPDLADDSLADSKSEEPDTEPSAFADSDTEALRSELTGLKGDPLPVAAAPVPDGPVQPDHQPVSSDEGVVRVYTIGDSSFTMYADGTIRADTPQGLRTFTTMEELKTYLDQRPVASSAKA
jgi:hypothetical protein